MAENSPILKPCPKCGGETATQHTGGDDSARTETFVQYCLECDWQGEPE